jgi:Phosphatidate cytidylyltransferase, mitochondrial
LIRRSDPRALLSAKLREAPRDERLGELVARLRQDAVRAIVFYGSLLADTTRRPDSFHDFYVIVDSLAAYHGRLRDRLVGRVLPPSIYYRQFEGDLRCKFCVLTADQLERELSPRARDIHNVGRFSKRVAVLWSRDAASYELVVEGCLSAARTLRPHALALLPAEFELDELIRTLLRLSYLGEQRVAEDSKVDALFAAERDHYRALYGAILDEAGLVREGDRYRQPAPTAADRRRTLRFLARSRRRGKLRWPKYIVTVDNWLEIALAKVERHHGVKVELTARERRWPLIFGWRKYFALKRRGVVK